MAPPPNASTALYNEDLAPAEHRNWGAFSIFNVWTSDVHSLWGYYLAASLFLLCGNLINFIIAIGIGSIVIFWLMSLVGYAWRELHPARRPGFRGVPVSRAQLVSAAMAMPPIEVAASAIA